MTKLRVDIWSDIACPWCYVGKRRLEGALAAFEHRERIAIVWRAFELDPSAPRVWPEGQSYAGKLAAKYGVPVVQAEAMIERMVGVAAAEGLDFRFDRIRPGNTFDAHRLLHAAHERAPEAGVQDRLKERLLLAYFTEGEPIGDHDVLARCGREAGLTDDEVNSVLASDAHAASVRRDEAEARANGVQGVPFFVFGGRYGVSGAQPSEALLGVLERAFREGGPAREAAASEGATCGPDSCQ